MPCRSRRHVSTRAPGPAQPPCMWTDGCDTESPGGGGGFSAGSTVVCRNVVCQQAYLTRRRQQPEPMQNHSGTPSHTRCASRVDRQRHKEGKCGCGGREVGRSTSLYVDRRL
jgi:hypothetical protein